MFVLMISRSSLKLGYLISKISLPGQIKGKPCWCSRGHIFEVVIMNLAQNVCLDDFKVMYSFLSSDSLKFFHLGQFLIIIGPTEWYLVLVKCLYLGQILSNYCSYSQWYLVHVHAYILAWPLECSHPYLTFTFISQSIRHATLSYLLI